MVKQTAKKTTKKQSKLTEYEPGKMGFAVAAMAAVSLVLFAVIAMQ